jgi:hypothetical protein
MPAEVKNLKKYDQDQAKEAIDKKIKFILFEDTIQISLQLLANSYMGISGFSSLVSPFIGLLSMFKSITEWQLAYMHETSTWTRLVKFTLVLVQLGYITFVFMYCFVWNSKHSDL